MGLENEIEIMKQIDHPNIVKLFEVFEDESCHFLVMELMKGREVSIKDMLTLLQLFDQIMDRETFSEKEAADTIRPIIDAINYCHSLGIIHRDIKVN